MKDRVCLVTGASRGIGRETALALAQKGATVVLVCRDKARGEAVAEEVRAQRGGGAVELLLADLSSQDDIRKLAAAFKAKHDRLHVLVNNAGAIFMRRELTKDGLEATFAVNHLAYFLLTELLLDVLEESAPSRVVNVSSTVHHKGTIAFDDLQGARGYGGMRAYAQSKLANVLFTNALARRLAGKNVTVNSLHPGVIGSNFLRSNGGIYKVAMALASPFMMTEKDGAETTIYLATSPEVDGVTGKYFVKKKTARSSRESLDEDVQERLWKVSSELTLARGAPAASATA
jgi:NAD(P)-dependent dehydrogenase (short-subunit alcohol dehydrogenase family)